MMERIEKIQLIRAIVIVGFICSVIFHYVQGAYLGKGYPLSTFLYVPDQYFEDFMVNFYGAKSLHPYANKWCVNFPFAFTLLYPLTIFKLGFAYASIVVLSVGGLLLVLWRQLPMLKVPERIFTTFALVIASYPILFAFDRGNFELVMLIFLGLFVIFYKSGRDSTAAICLACAIAIKIYPVVFVGLFIVDRKWKPCVTTAFAALVLTLGSAALLHGGISSTLAALVHNLSFFEKEFIKTPHGLQHSSSMYVPITMVLGGTSARDVIGIAYPFFAISLFLCAVAYIEFIEKTFWKRVAVLTFMLLLLPQVSYDYKLIHIFVPMILYMIESKRSKYDVVYGLVFGLLLIPKDYFYLEGHISINGPINVFLMLMFLMVIVYEQAMTKPGSVPSVDLSP